MSTANDPIHSQGMLHLESKRSVDETVQRLESLLQEKGVKLFAVIDHSGEAAKAGMEMHPTKVLIFGNPKGGTPVMLAAPGIAIDLPLKALIWEDASGKTWLSYNDAQYLKNRHNVPGDLIKNLTAVEGLLKAAVV